MGPKTQMHHHHIIPTKVAVGVGATLLFLTGVTVWIAHVDLGPLNFPIAMVVATIKALLVALIFMNLLYDRRENGMIFATSFLFLAIFIVLTGTDLFFRGDVYVKGPLMAAARTQSKLKNPWISTPELVAKGKELYKVQCVSCHGDGKGDGPAASALNPRPRDFTVAEGWKNGRKPTMVFKTLKDGLPPSAMASYATLPSDDRWALTHYVLSMGSQPVLKDVPADFAKIGIDPNKAGGGATEAPTISIALAMSRIAEPETPSELNARGYHPEIDRISDSKLVSNPGAQVYQAHCIQCHGARGEGGIKVKNLGVNPIAFITTRPFTQQTETLKSQDAFGQLVIRGIPGELMPAYGHLGSSDMRDLYQFVKGLAAQ